MRSSQSIEIVSSPLTIFKLTQNYSRRLEWDPFLSSARLLNEASEANVGVSVLCVAKTGFAMETQYVSFNSPRTVAIRMTHGPWFIREFAGTWRFEEISHDRTRVTFSYHLQAQPRWAAWLLNPILSCAFARDTRRRLAALKEFIEREPFVDMPTFPSNA